MALSLSITKNQEKNKIPKYFYLIIAFLIISISLLLINLNYQKKTKNVSKPKITANLSSLEIAKITLDWLDKQRDKNGVYTSAKTCEVKNPANCEIPLSSNRDGMSALWGRFNYYEKTKDSNELTILKNDLKKYADRNIVQLIQNNFWDCLFMYNLWKSDSFNQEEKNQIEKICFDGEYGLTQNDNKQISQLEKPEQSFGVQPLNIEQLMKTVRKKIVDLISQNKPSVANENKNISEKKFISRYGFYISDLVAKSYWKENDFKFVVEAYYLFDKVLDELSNSQNEIDSEKNCSIGIAALSMSGATKNWEFKSLAQFIYDQESQKIPNQNLNNSVCVLFFNSMYQLNKSENYKEKRDIFLNTLINFDFDYPGYKNNLTGNGGFLEKGDNKFTKDIRYNGLLVGILSIL